MTNDVNDAEDLLKSTIMPVLSLAWSNYRIAEEVAWWAILFYSLIEKSPLFAGSDEVRHIRFFYVLCRL